MKCLCIRSEGLYDLPAEIENEMFMYEVGGAFCSSALLSLSAESVKVGKLRFPSFH